MLREEVLKVWSSCKEKLTAVRLSPQDKEAYEFLENSKTGFFSIHSRIPLEQSEKEVEAEQKKVSSLDPENEMLLNYYFCWSSLASLILEWISSRRLIDSYLTALKDEQKKYQKLVDHLYSLNAATSKQAIILSIKLSPRSDYSTYYSKMTFSPTGDGIETYKDDTSISRSICEVNVEYTIYRVLVVESAMYQSFVESNCVQKDDLYREVERLTPMYPIIPD